MIPYRPVTIRCLLFPLLVTFVAIGGDLPRSATLYGYVAKDRWGQNVFHNGPDLYFLSDAVATQLVKYRDKPLKLEASEISQLMNPGAGMIQAVKEVSIMDAAEGLVLTAKCETETISPKNGLSLHLAVRNDSQKELTLWPGTLAVVLVTNDPSKSPPDFKDPDDGAYWYYSSGYHLRGNPNVPPLQVACRRIIMPWTAKDLVERGQHIRVADKDRGFHGPVVIAPKGLFEADVIVGKELLPGEYEVFFCDVMTRRPPVAGPMSKRIRFEVADSK